MALLNVPPPMPNGLVGGTYDRRRCEWMNGEGMTYLEWRRAADAFRRVPLGAGESFKAWKAGDDPTQYGDRG